MAKGISVLAIVVFLGLTLCSCGKKEEVHMGETLRVGDEYVVMTDRGLNNSITEFVLSVFYAQGGISITEYNEAAFYLVKGSVIRIVYFSHDDRVRMLLVKEGDISHLSGYKMPFSEMAKHSQDRFTVSLSELVEIKRES